MIFALLGFVAASVSEWRIELQVARSPRNGSADCERSAANALPAKTLFLQPVVGCFLRRKTRMLPATQRVIPATV